MLSCYGFAVLAHSMIGAGHSHGESQAATLVVALSDAPAGAADEASDDALSLDEAGSEHAELVNARNDAPALLRFTEQPPKLGLTTTVSPFLARPKRPPRAAAFVA
ncbi:hypothetical protein ACCC97_27620 [Variovorax sp. Varisp85]|nr:hypothetical protein PMI12_00182 [Variovorax sp. CF313]